MPASSDADRTAPAGRAALADVDISVLVQLLFAEWWRTMELGRLSAAGRRRHFRFSGIVVRRVGCRGLEDQQNLAASILIAAGRLLQSRAQIRGSSRKGTARAARISSAPSVTFIRSRAATSPRTFFHSTAKGFREG